MGKGTRHGADFRSEDCVQPALGGRGQGTRAKRLPAGDGTQPDPNPVGQRALGQTQPAPLPPELITRHHPRRVQPQVCTNNRFTHRDTALGTFPTWATGPGSGPAGQRWYLSRWVGLRRWGRRDRFHCLHFSPQSRPGQCLLIVRRVKDANPQHVIKNEQGESFPVWRHHAMFTDSPRSMPDAETARIGGRNVDQVRVGLTTASTQSSNGSWPT